MKINSVFKSAQLLIEIKKLINAGEYKPGDKFHSEQELAKIFETTQVTINKVTSQLVAEGILFRKQGVGTFINHKAPVKLEINISPDCVITKKPFFVESGAE